MFRAAGIAKSFWDYRCPLMEIVNDCGSEFGKTPFGGALFAQGVRTVSGSLIGKTYCTRQHGRLLEGGAC